MSLGVMGRVGSHHCIISGKNQLSVGTSCTMAIYKIAKMQDILGLEKTAEKREIPHQALEIRNE